MKLKRQKFKSKTVIDDASFGFKQAKITDKGVSIQVYTTYCVISGVEQYKSLFFEFDILTGTRNLPLPLVNIDFTIDYVENFLIGFSKDYDLVEDSALRDRSKRRYLARLCVEAGKKVFKDMDFRSEDVY